MKTVQVEVSDFRENLQVWLSRVISGDNLALYKHGKIIARIIPEPDGQSEARNRLDNMASRCQMDDVISPIGESWDAMSDYV
ncbi:type II toxin-antitoxin system Phd/YefM family antitoxin [Endozoicomonas sp. ALD040]|uniref:type II toxin-antitoxin system Phd/YefM family antitoxin n=1 Tax=unclassified Endozoicomonas TaxID=2644528 RepID=UPI003BAF04C4